MNHPDTSLKYSNSSTHPNPTHAKIAAVKLVTKTPYVSTMGRRPAIAPDMMMARNPLEDGQFS